MALIDNRDMTVEEAEGYLQEIDAHLFTDAAPLLGTGLFSLPGVLLIFCEHLAHLWFGNRGSRNTIDFMRQVMNKTNPNYEKFGGLLVEIYRHGPVHLRKPKVLQLEDRTLGWFVGATADQLWIQDHGSRRLYTHLHPEKCPHCDRWWLPLSMRDLFDDLRKAVSYFQEALRADPDRLREFNKARKEITLPVPEAKIKEYAKKDLKNLP